MERKTTFSVIIPTYNRSIYLKELLECLIDQSYKDFEVLICDDGSIDNTKEIVLQYSDKLNLKYFYDKNWGGPAKPRNVGIKNANGKWICFLDSDDIWDVEKLMEVSKVIHKDFDVFYHSFTTNLRHKQKIGVYKKSFGITQFEDLLYNGNKIVNSSLVIRTSELIKIGGLSEDKQLIGIEDYDLTIRLAKANAKFFLINKILGQYRINDSNISADYLRQLDRMTYLLSIYKEDVSTLKVQALLDYLLANYYLSNNKRKQGKLLLMKSIKNGSFQIKCKSFLKIIINGLKF